ncbi:MAG: transposase [Woeseiaceae bacterium]|nr:transposase [Woeseiaceae bacterium]
MPRFRRLIVPGYPHHVTQRGVRRQTTFFDDDDYRAYLALANELLAGANMVFYAYCLMPNHVHAIVVPYDLKVVSSFFATLHRRYARRTNARNDWRGHLWQERFYSVVMAEPHALAAMRYVELNPVRAGLVAAPEDWPWSSARSNLGMSSDPLVNREDTCGLISDWRAYLQQNTGGNELEALRKQTRIGKPIGDEAFLDLLEEQTGRRLRRKARAKR